MCAEVKIPALTKGRSQLSPTDVEDTRKLACVRIHVERVMGLVRQKYTILSGTIPMDFLQVKIMNMLAPLTRLPMFAVPWLISV